MHGVLAPRSHDQLLRQLTSISLVVNRILYPNLIHQDVHVNTNHLRSEVTMVMFGVASGCLLLLLLLAAYFYLPAFFRFLQACCQVSVKKS